MLIINKHELIKKTETLVLNISISIISLKSIIDNTMNKRKKYKQRSPNITEKTKNRTPLKTGSDLMCSGSVSSFCPTCAQYHRAFK